MTGFSLSFFGYSFSPASDRLKPVLLGLENALQFKRKLIPAKCRGAVAILPTTQCGQPPASVLHRECIKNGNLRPNELGCELPSLFRGNRGIEKNQIECAFPHVFRRDGLRQREG